MASIRGAALVLALEGHGAGYLPDIDRRQLTQAHLTQNGKVAWRIEQDRSITEPPGRAAPARHGAAAAGHGAAAAWHRATAAGEPHADVHLRHRRTR